MDLKIELTVKAEPALLEALKALFSAATVSTGAAAEKPKTQKAKTAAAAPAAQEEDLVGGGGDKVVTMEECREEAQKLISAGKTAKLKEVLKGFAVGKVVDLKKEDLASFMEKVKEA